jgi:hypothetical protein
VLFLHGSGSDDNDDIVSSGVGVRAGADAGGKA